MKLFKICTGFFTSGGHGLCHAAELVSADLRSRRSAATDLGRLSRPERFAHGDALKQQLMPDNIKQFETALKSIGLDPDKDVDTLTFASFRTGKQGVKTVGVAAGPFNIKAVLKKMKLQKYVPKKYGTSDIYPMDGGFVMSFLDDSTLLFGDSTSVRVALDTRDGQVLSLDTNGDYGRHDVERRLRAGVEHSRPARHAKCHALRHGRRLQGRRLRHRQETLVGLALHHELQQRREFRYDRRHVRLNDGGYSFVPGQGLACSTRK